jgi:hypothetical protein
VSVDRYAVNDKLTELASYFGATLGDDVLNELTHKVADAIDGLAAEPRTVTVKRYGNTRFTVEFSALPGRVFGPWGLTETILDLRVSALLDLVAARDLVLSAATGEIATTMTGETANDIHR